MGAVPGTGPADQVRDEGWAVVRGFVTAEEAETMVTAAQEHPLPRLSAAAERWIGDPRWADVVIPVVGPDVRLLRAEVLTKHPRSAGEVPWHQDNHFIEIEPTEFLTTIVAVDPMTATTGCLHVVPGSHRGGVVPSVPHGYVVTLADPPPDQDGGAVELDPGDLLLMSSLLFHRSGPNSGHTWRRTWLLQFVAADAHHPGTGRAYDSLPRVATSGRWQHPERG